VKSCGDADALATITRGFARPNFGPQPSAREDLEVFLVLREPPAAVPPGESR
jgi:hypothetical protein